MVRVRRQLGIGNRFDRGLYAEKPDHLARVLDVAFHPEWKSLDSLENLEGARWAYAGAEIAQALAPRAQQERGDGRLLLEVHAVKSRVGLGQLRKFSRGLPVENAAVDQHPADRDSVPAEELGGRVVDEIRAMIEGLQQIRRREGRIDEQRQFRLVRDLRHRRNIEHVEARIPEGLAEEQPRVWADRIFPGAQVARVDEARLDAEA